ncbi:MAG: hypothetical protein ACREF4_06270 [Gammaproteobacteria bacterium]
MKHVPILLALACALALTPVAAQQKPVAELTVRKQSGIPFVSGGMTAEERQEMQRVANKYPMQLVFTADGQPPELSGVRIKVRDLRGDTLIDAVADGPLFYFNPPSGRWTMEAEWNGEKVTRTVDLVGRRYIVLEFRFQGG